jgi:hypothetical protein
MMRYLRNQEHFARGYDGEATLVQAMFADFFVSEDVANASTGIKSRNPGSSKAYRANTYTGTYGSDKSQRTYSAVSASGKRRERKRFGLSMSQASGSSGQSHAGAVRRVERIGTFTILYFRARSLSLSDGEMKALATAELKAVWLADVSSTTSKPFCSRAVLGTARAFHFCNLFRNTTEKVLIRSPRGEAQTGSTFVETDEPGSF